MSLLFVLGANDTEMVVIAQLLTLAGQKFVQPQRSGDDLTYTPADVGLKIIETSIPIGRSTSRIDRVADGVSEVIFVECRPGEGWEQTKVSEIDHHGDNRGRPASVTQVVTRLSGLNIRLSDATLRWVELVAANDTGGNAAMLALGATSDELARIGAL